MFTNRLFSFIIHLILIAGCSMSVNAQNFVISGGNAFTVGRDAYGNVWAWGDNTGGQLGQGTFVGYNATPQMVNTNGVVIKSIDGGSASHVVALDCDGQVWTWGDNWIGQLGNPAAGTGAAHPVQTVGVGGVGYLSGVKYVTSSTTASYALLGDGRLVAWGGNQFGELGNGTTTDSPTPVYVTDNSGNQLSNIVAVDAGDQHCYALDANGYVWAWGGNQWGDSTGIELGIGGNSTTKIIRQTRAKRVIKSNTTTDYLTNITMITSGDTHGLFLDASGALWSIGGDWAPGQRGNTAGYDWQYFALRVAGGEQGGAFLTGVKQIAAGQRHSIALVDTDGDGYGRVMVWGGDYIPSVSTDYTSGDGVLGRGAASYTNQEAVAAGGTELPIYVHSSPGVILENIIGISDGDGVTYMEQEDPVTKERKLLLFGNNNRGQLGVGHTNPVYYPIEPLINYPLIPPPPDAQITAVPNPVCVYANVTLKANTTGQYYHYMWFKDGVEQGNNDTTNASRKLWTFDPIYDKEQVVFTGPGNYKVIVIDLAAAHNCLIAQFPNSVDSIDVTAFPMPADTIITNSPICAGATLNLSASAGASYNWAGPVAFTSTAKTPTRTSATAAMSGVYTVTVTTANGCTQTSTTTVTVNALPTVTPTATEPCVGGDLNLSAGFVHGSGSGIPTYAWTSSNAYTSAIENPVQTSATTAMSGTYTVSVTDNKTCTASASVVATVNPLPTVNATNNGPVCLNTTLSVNVNTNGTIYNWAGPNGFNAGIKNPTVSTSVTAAMAGTYTVTITDAKTCSNTDTTIVTVNPLPTPVASSNAPVCANALLSLDLGAAYTSYSWSGPAAFASAVKNPTVSAAATTAMTGIYTVSVTDNNNCTASDTITVTVHALPSVNAGIDKNVCKTDAAHLQATTTATVNAYLWSHDGATTLTSTNTDTTSGRLVNTAIVADEPHTYTVSITDDNGCTATDDLVVIYKFQCKPSVDIIANTPICEGGNTTLNITVTSQVNITALTVDDGNGPQVLVFAGAVPTFTSSRVVAPTTTTTYTVEATDANTNTGSAEIEIVVNPLPTITVSAIDVCPGTSASITATGGGLNATYSWDEGTPGDILTKSVMTSTTYVVSVSDANGCTDTENGVITINPFPTVNLGPDMSMCSSDTAHLNAASTMATGYLWAHDVKTTMSSTSIVNPLASLVVTAVAADETYNYTVTVTDSKGCTASDEIAVTYELQCKLYVNITANPSVLCLGDTSILKATINSQKNIASVEWIVGGVSTPTTVTGSVPNFTVADYPVSPSATTTYTLKAIDVSGTDGQSDIEVTVNPLPIVNAGPDLTICSGNNATLTVANNGPNGIKQTVWMNNTTTSIIPSTTVSPTDTTTYMVLLTDNNDCKSFDDVIVNVNALPTANAGKDTAVCPSKSVALTAGGGVSYSWTTGDNTASTTVTPLSAMVYTVTVTDANSCSQTDDITVLLHAVAVPSAGTDVAICLTQGSTQLKASDASGVATYLWHTGNTTDTMTVAPATAGDHLYTVTVTTANGCSATDDVKVTVNTLPVAALGADKVICAGQNTILSDANATMKTYAWGGTTGTTKQVTVAPVVISTYTITITDNNNCTSTDEVVVDVKALPTVAIAAIADACVNTSSVSLTAGSPSGGVYKGAYVNSATGEFNATAAQVGTHAIYYKVTNADGCSDSAVASIQVIGVPVVSMTDQTVCEGSVVTMSAGDATRTYTWNDNITTGVRQDTAKQTSTYTVTVTQAGCTSQGDVTINVDPIPVVDFSANALSGCAPFSPTFTDNTTPTGVLYEWDFGDGRDSSITKNKVKHKFLEEGVYSVSLTVTTATKCKATLTKEDYISVYPIPDANFSFSPSYPTTANPEVLFTDLSIGTIKDWFWNFNDVGSIGNTISDEQYPMHSFSKPGTFKVKLKVVSDKNCVDSVIISVPVKTDHYIFMPNAFTPDGDGINEDVYPQGVGFDMETIEFYVFSRWGEQIYYSIGYGLAWDGTKQGYPEILPEGVYAWLVVLKDLAGVEFKYVGSIALLH